MIDEDVKATHLETIASCLGVSEVKDPDAFIAAIRGLVGMSSEDESDSDGEPASRKPIDLSIVLGKGKK